MSSGIMITAHSGCEGTPENSVASMETGAALGADCVEIDVRMDAQGRLWLTHEVPESCSHLISLREAFELILTRGIAVNCDLKEYDALLPTLELAEKSGLPREKLFVSGSVDTALLEDHPEMVRRCRVFLNSEELVRDLSGKELPGRPDQTAYLLAHTDLAAKRFHALRAEALNAPYQYMPDKLITMLRARKVPLSLWTLDGEQMLREFMGKKLLNVTTRTVSAALAVRNTL